MSMADRVVLLNKGHIEQNDSPDQLYGAPSSEFSARFIGTPPMNLLALNGETRKIFGSGAQALVGAPGDAVKLGVRPEHIFIDPNGSVSAVVDTVEYFGADSIVVCQVGEDAGVAVRVAGHLRAEPGQALMLRWQPQQQHFFGASGKALPRPPFTS
jgi:sn-glycerol 3-phosphate transport system ATP-binding protein